MAVQCSHGTTKGITKLKLSGKLNKKQLGISTAEKCTDKYQLIGLRKCGECAIAFFSL